MQPAAISGADNERAERIAKSGNSDSGIWSSPLALLLDGKPSRRFVKLDSKSPAIAAAEVCRPSAAPSPSSHAPNAVVASDAARPRNVFDGPNSGRRSTNRTFASSGHAQAAPQINFAITGEPFAKASRSIACTRAKVCMGLFASYPVPDRSQWTRIHRPGFRKREANGAMTALSASGKTSLRSIK